MVDRNGGFRRAMLIAASLMGGGAAAAGTAAASNAAMAEDLTASSGPTLASATESDSESDLNSGYALPPAEILSIVDAPPNPALSFSPKRERVLFMHRPSLPPISELARPELKLAGVRIDPEAHSRSRMSFYTGVTIHRVNGDDTLGDAVDITGLPPGSKINFLSWSPDGQHLAFTVRGDGEEGDNGEKQAGRQLSLWVADVATGKARQLLGPPHAAINAVFDSYAWLDGSTLIASIIPPGHPPLPTRPAVPPGPKISDNQGGMAAQSRTFTDLLKDEFDARLLEHFALSQIVKIDINDPEGSMTPIGPPDMYMSVEPSHDGKYLLVERMCRPFSFEVPCGRFPRRVEVWRSDSGDLLQVWCSGTGDAAPVTCCRWGEGGSVNAEQWSSLAMDAVSSFSCRIAVRPGDTARWCHSASFFVSTLLQPTQLLPFLPHFLASPIPYVLLGDEGKLPVKGEGDLVLQSAYGEVKLDNVLLVDKLTLNLISQSQLDSGGCKTFSDKGSIWVFGADWKVIAEGSRKQGLYEMKLHEKQSGDKVMHLAEPEAGKVARDELRTKFERVPIKELQQQALPMAAAVSTVDVNLLHRRMGHAGHYRIKELIKKNMAAGVKGEGENKVFLLLYVDDILVAGAKEEKVEEVCTHLAAVFKVKKIPRTTLFLGMNLERNKEQKKFLLNQKKYFQRLRERFGGQCKTKPVTTPLSSLADKEVDVGAEIEAWGSKEKALKAYQSMVGSVMYPVSCTRVDVAYAASSLGQRVLQPEGRKWKEMLVADLPLADNIPVTFNSVRTGRRSINWRPDVPNCLYWVETQDGGDAKVDASPRDIVYTLPADPKPGQQPQELCRLDLRYGGITWGDEGLALVYESWFKTRRTRTWAIAPGGASGPLPPDQRPPPKLIFDRSYEDRYSDPGSPLLRRTSMGTYVLAQVRMPDGALRLLLAGDGASPEGNVPFLDLFDWQSGEKERVWRSDTDKYFETMYSLLGDQEEGPIDLKDLKLILSRESKDDPPQSFVRRWADGSEVQLTNFPHPYPSLRGLSKEIIRYTRSDGVQLTAKLFLPPGYNPATDGPLPTVLWAYPREYKSKEAAGQVQGSPNQFPGIGASSPLLFLARGYAVLSGPSMPIIGQGEEEANDRFVEQLVSSAEAAVDEVVGRGVAQRDRIAIGGHSYGAFMAANLLAHAPHLFACAIAQSGAYNRTLTPFSFQVSAEQSACGVQGTAPTHPLGSRRSARCGRSPRCT
ncbi:unnamed protein product [Closterium sp. NIES-64]|nr:unnamed protein product [Closterium sp. NIES-64]